VSALWPGIESLRDRINEIVRANVPAGPVALLEAPTFWSVGDNAIWTVEQQMASEFGWDVRYAATTKTFDADRLARALPPGGTVVFAAGGSLGDVWPRPQQIREAVCRRYTDRRIVVLTQGMHFRDERNLEHAAAAFAEHPDLTLLVRDHRSETAATAAFPKSKVVLTPDLVLRLGPLERTGTPTTDIQLLVRRDIESKWPEGFPRNDAWPPGVDWPDASRYDDAWRRSEARYRWFVRLRNRLPKLAGLVTTREMQVVSQLAEARFAAGVAMLSTARVVVTDRLHAHVLCLLLDIPHVVLDNNYGKLTALLDTWTGASPLVHRASQPDEAMRIAQRLVASSGAGWGS
jgi:exopolysaccharide biosynthesis predicted pyruvyltransferase EpsI